MDKWNGIFFRWSETSPGIRDKMVFKNFHVFFRGESAFNVVESSGTFS
jgi:hypothetical protein